MLGSVASRQGRDRTQTLFTSPKLTVVDEPKQAERDRAFPSFTR